MSYGGYYWERPLPSNDETGPDDPPTCWRCGARTAFWDRPCAPCLLALEKEVDDKKKTE